jgi:hypothetical protein
MLTLNDSGDVGGQKTLRTYWKNYFEKTDTLIWVVDATDRERIDDCRQELAGLLLEEARVPSLNCMPHLLTTWIASRGRKSFGIQKQERCSRSDDGGRGPRGTHLMTLAGRQVDVH